jgi:hypothetical protein
MPLSVTNAQASIVSTADTNLNLAFSGGVFNGLSQVVAALESYTLLTGAQQILVRNAFDSNVAAMMVALNIPTSLPAGLSTTVVLAQLTGGGSQGSMTFVQGLLTAYTAPT